MTQEQTIVGRSGSKRSDKYETFVVNEMHDIDPTTMKGFTVADQVDMQRMGKRQVFRRQFKFFTAVGFTCCVMGTWEILLTSNTQALLAGGKVKHEDRRQLC